MDEAKIYRTMDYSIFKNYPGNRKTKESTITVLQASIKAYGFLLPMIVCPAEGNGKYWLIDGQNRLVAAKREGEEVTYIIIPNPGIEVVPILLSNINSIGTKWSNGEYFQLWIEERKPGYIEIQKWLSDRCIKFDEWYRWFLHSDRDALEAFHGGRYVMEEKRRTWAEGEVVKLWEILATINNGDLKDVSRFRMATVMLLNTRANDKSAYNKETMKRQMERNRAVYLTQTRYMYLVQLVRIYNHSLNTAKQLPFPPQVDGV